MEESQREAMYNGWKNDKIFLDVQKTVFDDNVLCSALFEDIIYEQRFYFSDIYGSADPFTIAFSRLQTKMKEINSSIELKFPI